MNKVSGLLFAICSMSLLTLTSCTESPNLDLADNTIQQQEPAVITPNSEDPEYILVEELSSRITDGSAPFVFDVRAKASYAESHILAAYSTPYGQTDQAELDQIEGLKTSSEIVTYCGCPRHLSTLMARHLEDLGFDNVKVLYEGYWHWKDNNYPIVEGVVATRTSLRFEGDIIGDVDSTKESDVFIRNNRNGQLEAARTDVNGNFATQFEVLNFQPTDTFSVYVNSLEYQAMNNVVAHPDIDNWINISM